MARVMARVPISDVGGRRLIVTNGVQLPCAATLFVCGAGDGNRTRTVSLGTVRTHGRCARLAAGFAVTTGLECPMGAPVNGTLMARCRDAAKSVQPRGGEIEQEGRPLIPVRCWLQRSLVSRSGSPPTQIRMRLPVRAFVDCLPRVRRRTPRSRDGHRTGLKRDLLSRATFEVRRSPTAVPLAARAAPHSGNLRSLECATCESPMGAESTHSGLPASVQHCLTFVGLSWPTETRRSR
jgi:hypothetical protein